MKIASQKCSPVKIQNYDYNKTYNNVVIKNTTSIQEYEEKLSFPAEESTTTKLVSVNALKSMSPNHLVSMKGTIQQLSDVKTVCDGQWTPKKINSYPR